MLGSLAGTKRRTDQWTSPVYRTLALRSAKSSFGLVWSAPLRGSNRRLVPSIVLWRARSQRQYSQDGVLIWYPDDWHFWSPALPARVIVVHRTQQG
jgi:hypothetical protein